MHELQSSIVQQLAPIIGEEVCLLDTPNHRNSGDHLIWQGEIDFLRAQGIHKFYSCSYHYFNPKKLRKGTTILLHGGGNFGDIYPAHQNFRKHIVSQFKNHNIVVLPQTAFYQDRENLKKDATIFNAHPNLTICARDSVTYELLASELTCNILLMTDMAFCSNYEGNKLTEKGKTLLIQRLDVEKTSFDISYLEQIRHLTTSDWPSFQQHDYLKDKFRGLNSKISKLLINIGLRSFINDDYGVFTTDKRENHVQEAIHFLRPYELVITNRLHGFILAYLMGIPTIILNNSYGKNVNFYNSWLKEQKNVYFASNGHDLKTIIDQHFSQLLA